MANLKQKIRIYCPILSLRLEFYYYAFWFHMNISIIEQIKQIPIFTYDINFLLAILTIIIDSIDAIMLDEAMTKPLIKILRWNLSIINTGAKYKKLTVILNRLRKMVEYLSEANENSDKRLKEVFSFY